MTEPSLFQEITDFGNRANPWPLYEKLRSRPVWQEADGTFVVGTFREIYSLLHDPGSAPTRPTCSRSTPTRPDRWPRPAAACRRASSAPTRRATTRCAASRCASSGRRTGRTASKS
ncbi:hypothetical protein ACFQZ4_10635 [Catellatospora coxensis]